MLLAAAKALAGPCLLHAEPWPPGSDTVKPVALLFTVSLQCGETVTLAAQPYANWTFNAWYWDDGTTSYSNPLTFTLTGNRSVYAYFV